MVKKNLETKNPREKPVRAEREEGGGGVETEEWGKEEKAIGSAVLAVTGTMHSDHSAIAVSNPVYSLIPKPLPTPNGSLVLAIGSVLVSSCSITCFLF